MKKPLLMIILLLVSMVNMVGVSPVHASPGTTVSVDPPSIIDDTLQPETPETIRPMADGTYTEWTNKTPTIRPNSDGTFTDWVGNYADWDETTQDGDATCVNATAGGWFESSNLQNHTSETWPIARVQVSIVARAHAEIPYIPTDEKVTIMLVIGGTVYEGTSYALTTTYSTYSSVWINNPYTGSAWTWSDIDALEAGVQSVAIGDWDGKIRVTQLYVVVLGQDGTYREWDEATQNGDIDYVSATTGYMKETSEMEDITSPPSWTIAKVRVVIYARATETEFQPNVDGNLTVAGWDGWTKMGASPWLNASDYPTNYITSSVANDRIGNFTFADIPTGFAPSTVTLRIKTWKSGDIDGSDQLKIYLYNGTKWQTYTVTPTNTTAPGSYVEVDVTSFLNTVAKINAAMMALEHLVVSGADTIGVDHAYIYLTAYGDGKVQPILVVGGISYPATIEPTKYIPTTNYTKYTGDWGVNPQTKANWTWSDINLLQAGVQSAIGAHELWTGEIRVTQLYVEVAGPRFTHSIMVANVTDLFSWQVQIHYNPTILEVTGVSLKNQVFGDHDYYGPALFIDNTEGYALIFVGLLWVDPLWTFSGTGPGILCHINYLVKDIGVTPLHFSPYGPSTFLANSSKQLIPASTADGFFGNTILGDVTSDAKVNIYDLFNLGKAYSSIPNTPNWNPKCDFNWDGKVNASDLSDQSKNYGKSIP